MLTDDQRGVDPRALSLSMDRLDLDTAAAAVMETLEALLHGLPSSSERSSFLEHVERAVRVWRARLGLPISFAELAFERAIAEEYGEPFHPGDFGAVAVVEAPAKWPRGPRRLRCKQPREGPGLTLLQGGGGDD